MERSPEAGRPGPSAALCPPQPLTWETGISQLSCCADNDRSARTPLEPLLGSKAHRAGGASLLDRLLPGVQQHLRHTACVAPNTPLSGGEEA